jgi:cyclophilin family peptidyl-prolyl cis-trans isomerase
MSVVQAAPANAPGAFQTPFRGGFETVTNIGDMTFMLFRDIAPHTVDVMQGFTMSGLYTSNTIFHRVISGFVIQGGDPLTNGTGGPIFQYDDEFNPSAIFSGNGQLALANSGKDTDGSQFFVTLGPQRSLDYGYTLFGQLLRGFNVLSNINYTATDTNSRPLADVIITRASFVPDNFDTVITLTGTNLNGVAGIISIIADDGSGGRTTNSFTATTGTDTNSSTLAFFYPNYPNSATNLLGPVNKPLTNTLTAVEMNGDALYWFIYNNVDPGSSTNIASISVNYNTTNVYKTLTYNVTNIQGKLQLAVTPATNFVGTVNLRIVTSAYAYWSSFTYLPFDRQIFTFTFGDTAITALGTNFVAPAQILFTNQILATFTNGVANSNATNFTAFINWGDNSTNIGVILTNANGWKEVSGSHTYANAGTYPVYITVQSYLGASATVVSAASVPPSVSLAIVGTNNVISWPAWATDYQLQSATNLAGANWQTVSNFSTLTGYNSVVTNNMTDGVSFFRLKK